MPASRVVVVESSQSSLHVPVLSGMHAHSVRRPVAGHSESIISSCRARSVHARCGRRDAGRINGSILWWLLLRSAQRETLVLCLLAHSTSSATQYCFPCFIPAWWGLLWRGARAHLSCTKAVKERKTHRNAHDLDGKFIKDAMDSISTFSA